MSAHPTWSRSARTRLQPRHAAYFETDDLFSVVARTVCGAACLPRKELYESWEVARRILRQHRGGPVLDLAGGHGLVAWMLLLLDRRTPSALVVDRRLPESASRLQRALAERWPEVTARLTLQEGELEEVPCGPDHRVVGVHACGGLTDRVLDLALSCRARVAVLPCCHSEARQDAGGLTGWLPLDLAVDAVRAGRLRQAAYAVHTTTIPADITPMNRLLLGTPISAGG